MAPTERINFGWLRSRRPWRCTFGLHAWVWRNPKPLWRCTMVEGVPRPHLQTAHCPLCGKTSIDLRVIFDGS